MFDSEAYMSGAIPSGSWVPGQANGTSLSDRESAAGQPTAGGTSGGLHVNPLIGRGAAEINSGMGMGMGGMMNPLMMGRMAAFGGGGMGGMGARTKSQPNLYIPTGHARSQSSTGSPTPSQSPSQVHVRAHGHSLAHRQVSANTVPRSPLAKSYVAPGRGDEDGYFRPSHRSPLSPAARGSHNASHAHTGTNAKHELARGRVSRSVPTTPVYDGWAQEAVTRSAHAAALPTVAPTEASSRSGMSYDPPSSSSGSALAINYPGNQERAVLRHARGRTRSRTRSQSQGRSQSRARDRAHSGNMTDPDEWESHSGAPRNISPEAVYTKLQVPIRDKADSLPAPQVPSSRFYDDRRSRSQQPRAPTALRSESTRSVNKVVRIDSVPEGRQAQGLQELDAGDSVPLPLPRTPRPGVSRRHTSQAPHSPLPSSAGDTHVQVPMPSPSPLPSAHGRSRRSHIPRSMSHDTLDMYGLADDLPPLSPLTPRSRSRAADGGSQSPNSAFDPAGSRRTGYVAPLEDDEYGRYTAHPAAASPSTPVYALQSASGSVYAETRGSRGRSPIMARSQYGGSVNAAQAMMPSASMSTMMASPQTPADKPLMGSAYLTPGFPKPTRAIAWNRDGPTMKSLGIAWHRDVALDAPMSRAPSGPSWQQAAPPKYGPILPDRASSHGSGWWEAASRV